MSNQCKRISQMMTALAYRSYFIDLAKGGV